jgi:predicted membrane channel-forming protein YqfA (hemolysin III family)
MQGFLRYIELVLTAAGVLVVMVVFAIFKNISPWKAAAICAVVVSVVHGAAFYAVRAMQRRGRRQAVFSIRTMLDDLVEEKLDVVLYPPDGEPEDWRYKAQRAVWEIQARLNYIEAEKIKRESLN